MTPADTSPEVFAYQMDRYRELGPGGRSRMAAELSDAVRQTSLAAIRQRHPEYSEDEVRRTFVRVLYQINIPR
jgi:hypothetical protein